MKWRLLGLFFLSFFLLRITGDLWCCYFCTADTFSSPLIRLMPCSILQLYFYYFVESVSCSRWCRRDEKLKIKKQKSPKSLKFQFKIGRLRWQNDVVGPWLVVVGGVSRGPKDGNWPMRRRQPKAPKKSERDWKNIFHLCFRFLFRVFNSVNNFLTFPWTCLCNINDCLVLSLFSSSPCLVLPKQSKSEKTQHNKRRKNSRTNISSENSFSSTD